MAVLTLICVLNFSAPAAAQFETRSTALLGSGPFSLAVGDFNHDGKLDIAVAANQIEILLGNGDGTFQAPVSYPDPIGPVSIAASDLNHDGNLDLVAVGSLPGHYVSVLLGNSDGTFQPAMNFNITASPSFVGVADFNGDHKPDLIIVDSPYFSVMLGNGDGTFQAPIDTNLASDASAAWGDFNHDGKIDVAITRVNRDMTIFVGNGDGTFQPGATYLTDSGPETVTVADLRGNGELDLVVGIEFNEISVFLGNGDGTFQPAVNYPTDFPLRIAVADFNGDGKPDLVAADLSFNIFNNRASGVSVLLGNGDGTFQPPTTYPTGIFTWSVAVGDFNNDHKPDLADLDRSSGIVTVLLNTGTVTFSPTTPLTFAPTFVGNIRPPLVATLTNTGTTDLFISSISVTSPFRLNNLTNCRPSVAPGASCTIAATFQPPATGLFTGAVTIVDSASSKPQVIELIGSGTVITLSPGQLSFAPQKIGTRSSPQIVTITNRSNATVSVSYFRTVGMDSSDFALTDDCGSQIGPHGSCTASVVFAPSIRGKEGVMLDVGITGMGNPSQVLLRGIGK